MLARSISNFSRPHSHYSWDDITLGKSEEDVVVQVVLMEKVKVVVVVLHAAGISDCFWLVDKITAKQADIAELVLP